jgi:SAM-dependent methyltransferase
MKRMLLDYLRCPACRSEFRMERGEEQLGGEIMAGEIVCVECGNHAPIRDGIPRLVEMAKANVPIDEKTRSSFSFEWSLHRPEEGTWGMTVDERIETYFLKGVGLTPEEAAGLTVLDAGCGNGSSTLGISRLGATTIGIDLSSGIDKAREYFEPADREQASAMYVQGNLMDAPFKPESFDVIFSAGVLHHTPNTKQSFMALAPLVKPGGRFYVWLYRHEKVVTPIVNSIRLVTTKLPPPVFFGIAVAMSPAFQVFTSVANKVGLRQYRPFTWRSAALALLDIFGANYAHAHDFDEVKAWYEEAGFETPILRSMERRGFSVCGTKRQASVANTRAFGRS